MKYAIVTGSIKGIGKEIAVKLLERGVYVIMNYSSDDQTASEIKTEFRERFQDRYTIIKANLSCANQVRELVEKTKKISRSIDYIIFSAGATAKAEFGEYTYEEWLKVFDVNLNMPFMMLQMFDKLVNEEGRIIFISSVMSVYPHSSSIPYAVSKAAVNNLVQNMTKYYGERRITINSVITGFTNTTMINRTKEHIESINNKIALHRFAEAEEVANFVIHIIENGYINGALLEITGGYSFR